jgi:catechol 2,3-dioxygenase-like lactoylglutathione lyase family enzyme
MEVKNVRWVGVHTQQYDQMLALFGEVLGMRRHFEEPATVEFETTEGDEIQVMGPGHPYFEFFGRHATGPVPLFEVDDLAEALQRLVQARIEIVGPLDRDSHWEWLHFRAPDGHLYELAAPRSMDTTAKS